MREAKATQREASATQREATATRIEVPGPLKEMPGPPRERCPGSQSQRLMFPTQSKQFSKPNIQHLKFCIDWFLLIPFCSSIYKQLNQARQALVITGHEKPGHNACVSDSRKY